MEQTLIIRQLDKTTTEWIEHTAQRTGVPIETIVRQLIYRGLEAERQQNSPRYHDLDALAGTWSADEADEFRNAIGDFAKIDPNLWR